MNTLKVLLNLAMEQEVKAQKLYRRGAEIVKDNETKQFLNRLEKEEVEHEKMLFNIRETGMYDLDVTLDDPAIFETAKSSHGADDLAYDEKWTIEDIMEIALKREFEAKKRYEAAARAVQDEELVKLFTNLASDEENHHRVVDRQYKMFKGLMGKEL